MAGQTSAARAVEVSHSALRVSNGLGDHRSELDCTISLKARGPAHGTDARRPQHSMIHTRLNLPMAAFANPWPLNHDHECSSTAAGPGLT
eukprot:752032-Hanusia_phi.AAC.5